MPWSPDLSVFQMLLQQLPNQVCLSLLCKASRQKAWEFVEVGLCFGWLGFLPPEPTAAPGQLHGHAEVRIST